jgi:hypothetical protein
MVPLGGGPWRTFRSRRPPLHFGPAAGDLGAVRERVVLVGLDDDEDEDAKREDA